MRQIIFSSINENHNSKKSQISVWNIFPETWCKGTTYEVGALYQNLKPIIGPAPKLHDTGLLVKGEVFNVHLKNWNYFGFTFFVRCLEHKVKYQKLRYWFHRNFCSVYSLFIRNLLGTSIKSIKIFYVVKLFNIRLGKIHQLHHHDHLARRQRQRKIQGV